MTKDEPKIGSPGYTTYKVSQFETMFSIAEKFGTTLQELMDFNNIKPNTTIYPGLIIKIPRPIPPIPPAPPRPPVIPPIPPRPPIVTPVPPGPEPLPPCPPVVPPVPPVAPPNKIHIVRRGENIQSIARMYRVTVRNIMFMNNLRFPVVFPGQRLIIPVRAVPLGNVKK